MDVNTAGKNGLKLGALFAVFAVACACAPTETLTVRHDVRAALSEADLAHQPVLLFYSAPWCGACRALHTTLHEPKVARALRNTCVVQVVVDEHLSAQEGLPKHLQPQHVPLSAVPTLMLLQPPYDTAQVPTLKGYVGRDRLVNWLQNAMM